MTTVVTIIFTIIIIIISYYPQRSYNPDQEVEKNRRHQYLCHYHRHVHLHCSYHPPHLNRSSTFLTKSGRVVTSTSQSSVNSCLTGNDNLTLVWTIPSLSWSILSILLLQVPEQWHRRRQLQTEHVQGWCLSWCQSTYKIYIYTYISYQILAKSKKFIKLVTQRMDFPAPCHRKGWLLSKSQYGWPALLL